MHLSFGAGVMLVNSNKGINGYSSSIFSPLPNLRNILFN